MMEELLWYGAGETAYYRDHYPDQQNPYIAGLRPLLVGPAGTGKSQIAYAVARILKLPWTTLDIGSINDPEQLTGSSRIYANAKPGIILEAFSMAGASILSLSSMSWTKLLPAGQRQSI